MELAEYIQMSSIESTHWYFRGKRAILRGLLQHYLVPDRNYRILDIGCGTGRVLEMLQEFGRPYGVDGSALALNLCRQRGLGDLILADATRSLPFDAGSFDLVCAFDLLEHIPDEQVFFLEAERVLKPHGLLFLTVPAFEFLWSEHDVALGHFRRYRAVELAKLLKGNDLQIVKLTYYNFFLFPIACLYRLLRRAVPAKTPKGALDRVNGPRSDFFVTLPRWVNETLFRCFKWELHFLEFLNFPCGISLIGIARRGE